MKFSAEATARKDSGKGVARQIRRNGKIPAVVYGQGKSQLLEMDPSAVAKILMAQAGSTGLVSLRIVDGDGETQKTAVIQDHQVDPITGMVLHVDLFEVDMKKTVRVQVQVHITGSVPIGVKVEKGVLHQLMRELHIECLPNAIPDQVDIDASELGIGDGIHVRDVQAGPGVKILDDPDEMVVNVAAQISEEKLAAMLAGEPGEAAAAAPTEAAAGDKAKTEAAPAATKAPEPKK
jgi:large subunit ribosomal protein L25